MAELTERQFDALIAALPLNPKSDLDHIGGPGPTPTPDEKPPAEAPLRRGLFGRLKRSPLGLSRRAQKTARLRAGYAAYMGYHLRSQASYTEGSLRWDGISHRRNPWAKKPQAPHDADCSAYTTWALWIATRRWNLPDFVNKYEWRAGYTGTQTQHGVPVRVGRLLHGDLVFYGGTPSVPQHVAMFVGKGRVISMGQQGDPGVYPTDLYRVLPIVGARRYIR